MQKNSKTKLNKPVGSYLLNSKKHKMVMLLRSELKSNMKKKPAKLQSKKQRKTLNLSCGRLRKSSPRKLPFSHNSRMLRMQNHS